jgi:hypothetical protein
MILYRFLGKWYDMIVYQKKNDMFNVWDWKDFQSCLTNFDGNFTIIWALSADAETDCRNDTVKCLLNVTLIKIFFFIEFIEFIVKSKPFFSKNSIKIFFDKFFDKWTLYSTCVITDSLITWPLPLTTAVRRFPRPLRPPRWPLRPPWSVIMCPQSPWPPPWLVVAITTWFSWYLCSLCCYSGHCRWPLAAAVMRCCCWS